jgi:RNA recognition motif-containing protein
MLLNHPPLLPFDQVWKDATLSEWPENDFRIFVGDLGTEVTDELLAKAFNKYGSFAKAKVQSVPAI